MPEPKGKLDAMTGYSFSTPVRDGGAWVTPAVAGVRRRPPSERTGGPAPACPAWDALDWRAHEDNVRRLRQRIFKAAREQDWPKVRNLQKMMLRTWATPWSVCGR